MCGRDVKRLGVGLWIIDVNGNFEIVVVQTLVSFRHVNTDAMRMTGVIQPGVFVASGGLHDKCVIVLPVADRISPVARVGCILFVSTYVCGQRPAVRKDLPPSLIVLPHLYYAVGHGCERNSSGHKNHGARESQRIASIVRIVGFCDGVLRIILVRAKHLLGPRSHGRKWIYFLAHTGSPKAGQVTLGSGATSALAS